MTKNTFSIALSRKCGTCSETKLLTDFHVDKSRKQGRAYLCKVCNNKAWKKRYRTNEKYQKAKKTQKFLGGDTKRISEFNKRQRAKFPEKVRAREALRYAVSVGKIAKSPCEKCKENKVEGHHFDYSKPLVVSWLCSTHHKEAHGRLITQNP